MARRRLRGVRCPKEPNGPKRVEPEHLIPSEAAMPIRADVTFENTSDRSTFELGLGADRDIRGATVDAVVDTQVAALALPQDVVDHLALRRRGTPRVRRFGPEIRLLAGPLTLRTGGRSMVSDCIVGPPGSEPAIGSTVLTYLDLVEDQTSGKLTPRHPEWTLSVRRRGIVAQRVPEGMPKERHSLRNGSHVRPYILKC